MANNDRLDTIQILPGFPPAVKNVPPVWPTRPTPDKISLLWKYNNTDIYHRFNPYTEYELYFGLLPNKQPFVWRYPDEGNKSLFGNLPEKFKQFESRATPIRAVTDDLVRIGKYSISPAGVLFYIKQAALQLFQPFDETRIYNPLSPILATAQPLSLGLLSRPIRHIEGGLFGFGGLLGGVLGGVSFNTPKSTVGDKALPTSNTGQGKGLIRGATAYSGQANFFSKWPVPVIGLKGLKTSAANQGFKYKIDENSAKAMAISSAPWLKVANRDVTAVIPQMWYFKGVKNLQWPFTRSKLFSFGTGKGFRYIDADIGVYLNTPKIDGKETGYDIASDTDNYQYSYHVGPSKISGGEYTNSDMLVQYGYYITDANNYPSKLNDPKSEAVQAINNNLKNVINSIKIGTQGTIGVEVNTNSKILSSGTGFTGYNRIKSITPNTKGYGVQWEYSEQQQTGRLSNNPNLRSKVKSIDTSVRGAAGSLRMATTFKSDAIQRFSVLNSYKLIPDNERMEQYPDYDQWKAYEDDLIAFYFYDVVNKNYIPFRATVKGITENNNAMWDELAFIGRADKLYSYSGFSRTLNFSFNIVVNSVMELLPVWRKINYLASAVKPANYTVSGKVGQKSFNRFMIPPMFMITIGDLYKFQPVVITSININIPDDANWETLNELNTHAGDPQWTYLNGFIYGGKKLGKNFAQLPKEVEIQITCNLLEKERAIVGAAHFGHAPHTDLYLEDQFNVSKWETGKPALPYLPELTEFHKKLIVYNGSDTEATYKAKLNADFIGPPAPPELTAPTTATPTALANSVAGRNPLEGPTPGFVERSRSKNLTVPTGTLNFK